MIRRIKEQKAVNMRFCILLISLLFVFIPVSYGETETVYDIPQMEQQVTAASGIEKFTLLVNLSQAYLDKSPSKSIDYGEQAVAMEKKLKPQPTMLAILYNTLGNAYYRHKDYKRSIRYYEQELALITTGSDRQAIMRSCFNVAVLCSSTDNPKKALEYYQRSYDIASKLNDKEIQVRNLEEISKTLAILGRYKEAYTKHEEYLALYQNYMNLETSAKIQVLNSEYSEKLKETEMNKEQLKHEMQVQIEQKQEELSAKEKALKEKETVILLKDTLLNNASHVQEKLTTENINQSRMISQLSIDTMLSDQKIIFQKRIIRIVISLSVIILFSALLVLLFYARMRKAYRKIELQKREIQMQHEMLHERNTKILNAINYAERIQKAILPDPVFLNKFFDDSFVLYLPKDIVGGDFYWYSAFDDKLVLAAADCTGHGVPGGFMSMLGFAYLNQICDAGTISSPDEILNQLRNLIIRTLQQNDEQGKAQDGMDISLVTIDLNTRLLRYAGANNPVLIFHNNELVRMEPDIMPVSYARTMQPFEQKNIVLNKGDIVYMFTDGFADQLGGEENKKMLFKNFLALLTEYHHLPMDTQRAVYLEKLSEWRGSTPQNDDITLLGFRI